MDRHTPVRPEWVCAHDGQAWPCAYGRAALPFLYLDARKALGAYLREMYARAVEDRPEDRDRLHEQIVDWAGIP